MPAQCYGNVAVIGISVRPVTVVSPKRSPALSVVSIVNPERCRHSDVLYDSG